MRIKTYIAANIADAMKDIRRDLGEDAVIVSTFEDGNEVSVTAALEVVDPPSLYGHKAGIPGLDLICDKLEAHMFHQDISEKLIAECALERTGQIAQKFVKAIDKTFRFCDLPAFEQVGSPILLVGPPGVGKSVTIAKLALKASQAGQAVHVITTDAQKAGAVAQLTSFANALSLTMGVARNRGELTRALEDAPPLSVVIVDTPGINPFVRSDLEHVAETILAVKISPILVLSGGGDFNELMDMIEAFSVMGTSRVILTKMDFVRRIGTTLSAVQMSKLNLMAMSDSPLVATPLKQFTAKQLALLILEGVPASHTELLKESA